jgi:(S)-ureidoglycine aminohydrolase
MKFRGMIIGLLFGLFCAAQSDTVVAKVYTWDKMVIASTAKATVSKKMFSGSGAILSLHQMNGIILRKGKSITYKADAVGYERFFIIKKGPVSVNLNDQTSLLDRGSIMVVLPGDKLSIANNSDADAEYYEMNYRSKQPADAERGKKAGTSFVMNWNDMVVKKTDKGSTRQLFDRQTAMLNRFDIHVTQLNEGFNSHPPHTHKNEEIILMLDGNAEMTIANEHPKANGGDVVFLTSLIPHNLTNIGKTPCLYFAIQWN